MSLGFDVIVAVQATMGESPTWSADGRFFWVDSLEQRIHVRESSGVERVIDAPDIVGCVAPRAGGGLIVALADSVELLDPVTETLTRVFAPGEHAPGNRFNDGKCDREGRFVVGSMDRGVTEPTAALYRIDPDLSASVLRRDVILGNGLDWSPDGRTLYFSDSGRHAIYAYDYSLDGELSNERVLVQDPDDVLPDGLVVDEHGYLWSAKYFGGRIERYTPEGELDRVVPVPVPRVTSLTFAGPDLDWLYVTSAAFEVDTTRYPLSGSVLGFLPGVRGLPTEVFRG